MIGAILYAFSRKIIFGSKWHYAGFKQVQRRKQGGLVRKTNSVLSNIRIENITKKRKQLMQLKLHLLQENLVWNSSFLLVGSFLYLNEPLEIFRKAWELSTLTGAIFMLRNIWPSVHYIIWSFWYPKMWKQCGIMKLAITLCSFLLILSKYFFTNIVYQFFFEIFFPKKWRVPQEDLGWFRVL